MGVKYAGLLHGHWITAAALTVLAGTLVHCGSDDDSNGITGGTGGTGGATGGTGGATGGTGGATGGTGGATGGTGGATGGTGGATGGTGGATGGEGGIGGATGGEGGIGGATGGEGGIGGATGGQGGSAGETGGQGGEGGIGGAGGTTLVNGPSCEGLAETCGPNKTQNCCEAAVIPGGSFPMGRCTDQSGTCADYYPGGTARELPEHTATVGEFALDLFQVTVGRFRRFVDAYPGSKPAPEAGKHPLIQGTGWETSWDSSLPADKDALVAALKCTEQGNKPTWTDTVGDNEAMPINCVNWYEAFAFCAWDGGRLPTEAEWEFAAAGGEENRLYPWGADAPSDTLANFKDTAYTAFMTVGSYPDGVSRWGQYDMAGGMWEWIFDWRNDSWYSGAGNTCTNCANVNTPSEVQRILRGGSFHNTVLYLRAANRGNDSPTYRVEKNGLRCARNP